ncbi:MAG: hypothetical protein WCZ27_08365 [Tissierellaceae bacterium]
MNRIIRGCHSEQSEESKGQSKDSSSPTPQNDRFTGSPDDYTYRVI